MFKKLLRLKTQNNQEFFPGPVTKEILNRHARSSLVEVDIPLFEQVIIILRAADRFLKIIIYHEHDLYCGNVTRALPRFCTKLLRMSSAIQQNM